MFVDKISVGIDGGLFRLGTHGPVLIGLRARHHPAHQVFFGRPFTAQNSAIRGRVTQVVDVPLLVLLHEVDLV